MADSAIDILCNLIRFESVSSRSNLDIIQYIESLLSSSGISSQRVLSADAQKASLLATIGPPNHAGVVLSAHTDVVPVEGQAWSVAPFAGLVKDRRVYGRGATDMKGFLAVVLAAIPYLVKSINAVPVHLAFSYDEEVGCRGAPDLVQALLRSATRPALAIIGEPTSMRIVRAHKGKVARRLTFQGRAGHSAMPHRAANAVNSAVSIAHELQRMATDEMTRGGDADFDPPFSTIHLGSLHGGAAVNLVPEHAVLEYEIRTTPDRNVGEILARIDEAVALERRRLQAAAPEADIRSEDLSSYPGLNTQADDPKIGLVAAFTGDTRPAGTVAFGTEAGIYAEAGIPSLVCGPGDMARGHKPDEWIGLDELSEASAMIKRLAAFISRSTSL